MPRARSASASGTTPGSRSNSVRAKCCLICNEEAEERNETKSDLAFTEWIMFVLTNLLRVPRDVVYEFVERYGPLEGWFGLCGKCKATAVKGRKMRKGIETLTDTGAKYVKIKGINGKVNRTELESQLKCIRRNLRRAIWVKNLVDEDALVPAGGVGVKREIIQFVEDHMDSEDDEPDDASELTETPDLDLETSLPPPTGPQSQTSEVESKTNETQNMADSAGDSESFKNAGARKGSSCLICNEKAEENDTKSDLEYTHWGLFVLIKLLKIPRDVVDGYRRKKRYGPLDGWFGLCATCKTTAVKGKRIWSGVRIMKETGAQYHKIKGIAGIVSQADLELQLKCVQRNLRRAIRVKNEVGEGAQIPVGLGGVKLKITQFVQNHLDSDDEHVENGPDAQTETEVKEETLEAEEALDLDTALPPPSTGFESQTPVVKSETTDTQNTESNSNSSEDSEQFKNTGVGTRPKCCLICSADAEEKDESKSDLAYTNFATFVLTKLLKIHKLDNYRELYGTLVRWFLLCGSCRVTAERGKSSWIQLETMTKKGTESLKIKGITRRVTRWEVESQLKLIQRTFRRAIRVKQEVVVQLPTEIKWVIMNYVESNLDSDDDSVDDGPNYPTAAATIDVKVKKEDPDDSETGDFDTALPPPSPPTDPESQSSGSESDAESMESESDSSGGSREDEHPSPKEKRINLRRSCKTRAKAGTELSPTNSDSEDADSEEPIELKRPKRSKATLTFEEVCQIREKGLPKIAKLDKNASEEEKKDREKRLRQINLRYLSNLHHISKFPCSNKTCKKVFSTYTDWFEHTQICTGENKLFQCSTCRIGFSSCRDLELHILLKHFPNCRKCRGCSVSFRRIHLFNKHIRENPNTVCSQKALKCEKVGCVRFCTSKKAMTLHTEICHKETSKLKLTTKFGEGEGPFSCLDCGKSYRYKRSLMRHQEAHEGMEYLCEQCGYSFITKHYLMRHITAVHKSNEPGAPRYPCHICGREFQVKRGMKEHLETHVKRKRLKCTKCGKKFRTKMDLCKHKVLHDPEKAERRRERQRAANKKYNSKRKTQEISRRQKVQDAEKGKKNK